MRFLRAQGILATAVGALALGGCDDPVQRTDLRPEGPPDVLAVLLMNDADFFLYERATFCKASDEKAPGLVGVSDFTTLTLCPNEGMVTDAVPGAWYARVMFDELLDPDVEDLEPVDPDDPETTYYGTLARTQPVNLTCNGTPVGYDGWYAPNGNNVTWPVGPSLVIVPTEFVATSATCELTIKEMVVDKDGTPVAEDQRGPFSWQVGPLAIAGSDPEPGGADIAPDGVVAIFFNAPLDPATVSEGSDVLVTGPGAAGATVSVDAGDASVILVEPPGAGWADGDYTVTIPTTQTITDARGGALTLAADYVIDFTVMATP